MAGDFFNEYLVPDFNALDTELNGSQWFQKQEDAQQQRALQEQTKDQQQEMNSSNTEHSGPAPTADPFRATFDRRKETETKRERLERIKQEYQHKPFISVGSWEDLRKRRDKRKQVEKQVIDESFKGGLAANSPNLTQEVEQNEPTIMPLSSMGSSVRGFCKKAENVCNNCGSTMKSYVHHIEGYEPEHREYCPTCGQDRKV